MRIQIPLRLPPIRDQKMRPKQQACRWEDQEDNIGYSQIPHDLPWSVDRYK